MCVCICMCVCVCVTIRTVIYIYIYNVRDRLIDNRYGYINTHVITFSRICKYFI